MPTLIKLSLTLEKYDVWGVEEVTVVYTGYKGRRLKWEKWNTAEVVVLKY